MGRYIFDCYTGQQTQEWQRQQQPWGFFQSHPQEGQQGGHPPTPKA